MRIQCVNPATGQPIEAYATMPDDEVAAIAAQCRETFRHWRRLTVAERAPHFRRLAATLRGDGERLAKLMTLEMGKPIVEARGEIEKCAWLCEVYAERAPTWLSEQGVAADGRKHVVVHEPLGVILSIMPWNFPFWQAFRFAVPTLMAGNTSVLKHASNVPQCAFAIEETFARAGFPPDVFRAVLAEHSSVERLIAGDTIAGVSLTGSTDAGARIAASAGKHLKKVVLELGGSDPFIVLDDADLEVVARNAVKGRCVNTGQSCIAAKRFIVSRPLAGEFTERFANLMAELIVGDPGDESTQIGPLVSEDARVTLEAQVEEAVTSGARVVCGGRRLERPGWFYEPTVLDTVTPAMRVVREEVFGPVAPVLVVEDEDEAVRVANATEFGLGASVWTRDVERGERVARRLEAGATFVNSVVKSDPRMPFGGVKHSGLGRELARYGLLEFVNVKGISVYDHA